MKEKLNIFYDIINFLSAKNNSTVYSALCCLPSFIYLNRGPQQWRSIKYAIDMQIFGFKYIRTWVAHYLVFICGKHHVITRNKLTRDIVSTRL